MKRQREERTERASREKLSWAKAQGDPEELETLRRRGIYEKAKSFEERVAELFALHGARTTVDYKRDDMQFDVRAEITAGLLPAYILVECKDTDRPVTQEAVRNFASKVEAAAVADRLPYQGVLVARSRFANNAHVVAQNLRVQLRTYEELLLALVDLRPNREAAVRGFQGTALERLYVEQDVVLEGEIRPGQPVEARRLTDTVRRWLDSPGATFLALLGDFGSGKTSFCRRLACELALAAAERPGEARSPVLIDLREGGSTTVTLENLLTHHFQRLSSQPFNPQALLHLNREGHLLLIFDGFDETIGYTEPGRYVENLRQVLRAAEGKAKVLLTCRTHYFRDRPEALRRMGMAPQVVTTEGATRLYEEIQDRPGSDVGYLVELREEQIEEYLRKALPPPADWRAFREQIRHTYNLENLAERPFLLEIIVKTLPRLAGRQGTVTLADLYETYCESWFSHTDFRLTLTRERKVALVEYLARLIWDSPENRVHYELLYEKAAEFFRDRPLTIYDKERIDFEVRTALFLHRDAEGYYSFIHRSFLEFFLARTLRAGLKAGDPACLDLWRITREVAFFLEFWPERERIPEVAGRVLGAGYQPRVSENALLLLYFHARAVLGPLVGPEAEGLESEEGLLTVRERFGGLRPGEIHLGEADLEGARLPGVDLGKAFLEGARLARADLRWSRLDGARLAGAGLGFADLRKASARGADLSGADLDHVDAREADLRKAVLREADLSFGRFARADLQGADLAGSHTVGAAFLGACLPPGASLDLTAGPAKSYELTWRLQLGHSGWINTTTWNPERQCVASGADDGTVKLWDLRSGLLIQTLQGHRVSVRAVAWAPNGNNLASAGDRTVRLWSSYDGRLLRCLRGHQGLVQSVAWAPDGGSIASGGNDMTVRLWNPQDGRLRKTMQGHNRGVRSIAWAPDGNGLASGSDDKTVRLWNPSDGRLLDTLWGHEEPVQSVAWAPDGNCIASGSDDGTLRLWSPHDGRLLKSLHGHQGPVLSVAWAPDGKRLASGCADQFVRLWDSHDGRLLQALSGHESWVLSVAWALDGDRLASSSADRTVRLWDLRGGRLLQTQKGYENPVLSVAWAPAGKILACSGYDPTVRLWDARAGRLLQTLRGHESWILSVAWAPDGNSLATSSADQTVRLWSLPDGQLCRTLEGHEHWIHAVAWAPDGKSLASGSEDGTVRLWDPWNGRLVQTFQNEGTAFSIAWAPDGKSLASGSYDGIVRLWNPRDGQLLQALQGHEDWARSVAWAPNGNRLASGSNDQTVRLWDSHNGRLLRTLLGHERSVRSVVWAPDGKSLASGSDDQTIRLWDPRTGQLLQVLEIGRRINTLTWEPDGRCLAVGLEGGDTQIWDVESTPPRLLAHLQATPGGSGLAFTPDGYVSGPPEALEYVRLGDGWALYDLTDLPERLSPERVAAALNPARPQRPARPRARRKPSA